MHLFSYDIITQVDIFTFEEVLSSLGDCYLPDSRLDITRSEDERLKESIIIIAIESTGLCTA